MPTLHWIGKDKVINHHIDVPFKVLEHAYGFDNGTHTNEETNSGNKIIHGEAQHHFQENTMGYNKILDNEKINKTGIFQNMEIYVRHRYSKGIFRY